MAKPTATPGAPKAPAKKPIAKRRIIDPTPADTPTSTPPAPTKPSTSDAGETAIELRTEISKKELIERMVEQSDMKKGEARRAADATLLALASALRSGADIAAAPLGKIRITKQKETANGTLVVCRMKLKSPE